MYYISHMADIELTAEQMESELRDSATVVGQDLVLEAESGKATKNLDFRPIYTFEREILEQYIDRMSGRNFTPGKTPIKGKWIHGWLDAFGEDYINSVWRGFQFFSKYLKVQTNSIQNVAAYNRNPGEYESMYRYILLLEDFGLVERYRTETVPLSEYDQFVPENIRQRTFVRNTDTYEGNEALWDNPFSEAYGEEGSLPDDDEEDVAPNLGPIEPEEDVEPDTDTDDVEIEVDPLTEDESDEVNIPDEDLSVKNLPDASDVRTLCMAQFDEAIQQTFEQSPFPVQGVEPDDMNFDRLAAVGAWVEGEADKGQTSMELVLSVDATEASTQPGFVVAGLGDAIGPMMRDENVYPDLIPNYVVTATYSSAFVDRVKTVLQSRDSDMYYVFGREEFEEL